MKKLIFLLFASVSIWTSSSAQVIMGDINGDGKLTMEDITKCVDMLAGNTPTKHFSTCPINNKAIEGVWWKSRNESISFNADNTTDHVANSTYYYMPELHSMLLRNSAGVATELIDVQISEGVLVLRRGGNTETYYSERPPQLATSITLSSTSFTTFVGDMIEMSATVSPEDVSNPMVTWSSSDESVATVNEQGVVVIRARGTATITATAADGSGVTASCQITGLQLVSEIELSTTEISILEGETYKLTATVGPTDADNKEVLWSSEDESIATVSSTGVVTAVGEGSVTITATAADGSGVNATCEVTVEKLIRISEITLSKTSTTIELGQEETITATALPENAHHKTLTWKSSNERIATVDKNGVIHAQGIGTATITVTSADEPKATATCTVTITGTYKMYFGNINYTGGELPVGTYSKDGTITDGEHFNYIELQDNVNSVYEKSSSDPFTIKIRHTGSGNNAVQPYIYLLVPRGITGCFYGGQLEAGDIHFYWNRELYEQPCKGTYVIDGVKYDKYIIDDNYGYGWCDTISKITFFYSN